MTLGYTCLTKHDLDYPSTHGGQASQAPGIAWAASLAGSKGLGKTRWVLLAGGAHMRAGPFHLVSCLVGCFCLVFLGWP